MSFIVIGMNGNVFTI